MRCILVFVLASLAHARPEAGYPSPSNTYGAPPSLQVISTNTFANSPGLLTNSHGLPHNVGSSGFPTVNVGVPSTTYEIPPNPRAPSASYGIPQNGFQSNPVGVHPNIGNIAHNNLGVSQSFGGASFGNLNTEYAGGYKGSFDVGYSNGAPTIYKHVYVHVAPPEDEVPQAPRIIVQGGPPKKHYKIVFIKTPNQVAQPPTIIQPQQQDQEKTLIYVLAKRPEQPQPIVLPAPPATPPSKPEVYFIKYKTEKETIPIQGSGHGINAVNTGISAGHSGVQTHHNGLGASVGVSTPSPKYGAPNSKGH